MCEEKQLSLYGREETQGFTVCPVCGKHEIIQDARVLIEPCENWLCKTEYRRARLIVEKEKRL